MTESEKIAAKKSIVMVKQQKLARLMGRKEILKKFYAFRKKQKLNCSY